MSQMRIKFEDYKGVLYCDAIFNDEFTLSDLEAIREEIRKNYTVPADVIYKRTGSYSVAADAQMVLWKGIPEFRNFIYVFEEKSKENPVRYATETYMFKYNARAASTKEEAYAMLRESS